MITAESVFPKRRVNLNDSQTRSSGVGGTVARPLLFDLQKTVFFLTNQSVRANEYGTPHCVNPALASP